MMADAAAASSSSVVTFFDDDDDHQNVLHFSQLVRPASMRSQYWRYFGFPATRDGVIMTRRKIVCTICQSTVAYNRNTTNLIAHLRNRHRSVIAKMTPDHRRAAASVSLNYVSAAAAAPDDEEGDDDDGADETAELSENESSNQIDENEEEEEVKNEFTLEIENGENAEGPSENNGFIVEYINIVEDEEDAPKSADEPLNNPTISDDLLVNVLIENALPATLVHSSALTAFCTALNSNYRLPNVQSLETGLIERYSQRKACARNALHAHLFNSNHDDASFFSIGIDRWTNRSHDTFLTVYAFHVSSSAAAFETTNLGTLRWQRSQTDDDWARLFDNLPLARCTAVLLNFPGHEHAALQSFLDRACAPEMPQFVCLHHAIGEAARACLETENMRTVFEAIRDLDAAINAANHHRGDPTTAMDWQGKFAYLQAVELRVLAHHHADNDNDDNVQLRAELAEIVAAVSQLLMPLGLAQQTIVAERTPCASLVHPIVQQLLQNHFAPSSSPAETDDDVGAAARPTAAGNSNHNTVVVVEEHMKRLVRQTFERLGLVFNVHAMAASLLDPRFQSLIESGRDLPALRQQLRKHTSSEDSAASSTSTTITSTASSCSSSSRLSAFLQRKPKAANSAPPLRRSRFDIQLDAYCASVDAAMEECPLQWWRHVGAVEYAQLTQLAARYLCVPAVLPCGRLTVEQRARADAKRQGLAGDDDEAIEQAVWLQEDLRGIDDE